MYTIQQINPALTFASISKIILLESHIIKLNLPAMKSLHSLFIGTFNGLMTNFNKNIRVSIFYKKSSLWLLKKKKKKRKSSVGDNCLELRCIVFFGYYIIIVAIVNGVPHKNIYFNIK